MHIYIYKYEHIFSFIFYDLLIRDPYLLRVKSYIFKSYRTPNFPNSCENDHAPERHFRGFIAHLSGSMLGILYAFYPSP